MKRCIFHVPRQMVAVHAVLARNEAEAWQKLARGDEVDELGLQPGNTASGKTELVTCLEVTAKRPRRRRTDNE